MTAVQGAMTAEALPPPPPEKDDVIRYTARFFMS